MPSAHRAVPSISLVVSWPGSVTGPCAEQLARRLAQARINSTWAIEDPAQVAAIQLNSRKASDAEMALLVGGVSNLAEAIDHGLARFERAGQEIVAIQVDRSLSRGGIERRLRHSGVRAVIAGPARGKSPIVRPLPFGIWEFGPQISTPSARRWLPRVRNKACNLRSTESPAVANIDITKLAAASSRGWSSVERLIDEAGEISALGIIRILTISDVAAELSEASAIRPQRSILRAAA
jgi:hypothetical protein